MIALVIGATGATGKDLVHQLLENKSFEEVHIFVRKHFEQLHQKLKIHVIDFERPQDWEHLVKGTVAFSCMGTTLKAAGSKAAQRKVDYDYQYNFAKAASENKVDDYVLISAYGADAGSAIFYNKLKGELENAVKKLRFKRIVILRPGLLERKNTRRFGEALSGKILKMVTSLGLFKRFKPLPTSVLAKAMINALHLQPDGITAIRLNEIFNVAGVRQPISSY
ncbi:NAD(P)H-binding protein [Niabella aquatica]